MPHINLLALFLSACNGGIQDGTPGKDDSDTVDPTAPEIELDVASYDFGDVPYGQLIPASVTIFNAGGSDLSVTSITTEAPFTVNPPSGTIASGGTMRLTINVQAITYEQFTSAITIQSNDEDEATFTVPLTAHTIDDVDADGHTLVEAGGDDCDDTDPDVYTGAEEVWYNGIDENCDGANDYDQDGDGYETDAYNTDPEFGGGDCQDVNGDYHPGADDVPYDNRDTDCRGNDDWDFDGDGYQTEQFGIGSDCDDNDAEVNRNGLENFNAKDDDCDGEYDEGASIQYAPYIYEADNATDRTGYATAIGDLDGDDYPEIVIGSPYAENTAGSVAIFDGRNLLASNSDVDRAEWFIQGDAANDRIGEYVTVMGDFDGDGVKDLAIGAPNTVSATGTVYLISGDEVTSNGDLSDSMLIMTGTASSQLGRGISTSVDLDGDGQDELIADYYTGTNNAFAIVYGNGSPPSNLSLTAADAQYSITGAETAFYRNAPVGADMDGDGYADLVRSDGTADQNGASNNGAAWILWGQSARYATAGAITPITAEATTVLQGTSTNDYAAWCTQPGEDWDGDGDAELWAYYAADGLYVFEGRPRASWGNLPQGDAVVSYIWDSSSTDVEMLRQIGDWTRDGLGDMMAFLEDGSSTVGSNEMFSSARQSGEWTERDDLAGSLDGNVEYGSGNAGYGLSPLYGDIENDGDSDIVVGDPSFDSNAGEAYVLLNRTVD